MNVFDYKIGLYLCLFVWIAHLTYRDFRRQIKESTKKRIKIKRVEKEDKEGDDANNKTGKKRTKWETERTREIGFRRKNEKRAVYFGCSLKLKLMLKLKQAAAAEEKQRETANERTNEQTFDSLR